MKSLSIKALFWATVSLLTLFIHPVIAAPVYLVQHNNQPLVSNTPGIGFDITDVVRDSQPDLLRRRVAAYADSYRLGDLVDYYWFNGSPASSFSRASFTFSDVSFTSSTDTFIDVSLDLLYEGSFYAYNDHAYVSGASASLNNRVQLNGVNASNSYNYASFYQYIEKLYCASPSGNCSVNSGQITAGTHSASITYNRTLTHTWTNVPTNTPLTLEIGIQAGGSVGYSSSFVSSDFYNSMTFANPGAVFQLPAGVIANSADMGLVNNTIAVVPLPGAAWLFVSGLLPLLPGLIRRQTSHGVSAQS